MNRLDGKRALVAALIILVVVALALSFSTLVSAFYLNLGDIELNRALRQERLAADHLSRSAGYFQQAIRWRENSVLAHRSLGKVYFLQGDDSAALEALSRYIDLSSDEAKTVWWLIARGDVCLRREDYTEAQRAYGLIERLVKDRAEPLLYGVQMAGWLVEQGKSYRNVQVEEASCRLATVVAPHSAQGCYALGNFYRKQKRWAAAIEAYQAGMAAQPETTAQGYMDLSLVYLDMGAFGEAVAALEKAADYGAWGQAHLQLGRLYESREDVARAVEHYQKAVGPEFEGRSSAEERWEAYVRLGAIWERQGQYDWSVYYYRGAARLAPDRGRAAQALYQAGQVYQAQGHLVEALDTFREALERVPASGRRFLVEVHNALGDVYRELGQAEQAEAQYRKALELEPENKHAREGLKRIRKKQ